MKKKDVLELKRRLNKNACTFTRVHGCYVNSDKKIVTHIRETFLNLDDTEFFKYLDIARKVLSGTIGNNLLELEFPLEQEKTGGMQQFLLGLRESKLKNELMLDKFYDMVIENYDYVGNYLILVFHDAYDVITKTSDGEKLDESEEVYEYLLCAICPVNLSKPGLGYIEDENYIASRIRDWVVGMPDTGFVFPAFTDRSADIHSLMFYTKDTKHPHSEFMESGLGCKPRLTATEKKNTFKDIIFNIIDCNDEESGNIYVEINEAIYDLIDIPVESDVIAEDVIMDVPEIEDILDDVGLTKEQVSYVVDHYKEAFSLDLPLASELIDTKLLTLNAQRKERLELITQITTMKELLQQAANELESPDEYAGEVLKGIKGYLVF